MAITPKAQATALRISNVAATLFLERGFSSTTIAQVAESAGVATGTVLLHFGSKSDLATAAFSQRIETAVAEAVDSMPDALPAEQVGHIVEHMYSWYGQHGEIAAALLRESLFSTGPAAQQYNKAVSQTVSTFQTICATHQANGSVAGDVDTALLAEGLLADYLLVLLQGFRARFASIDEQIDHFNQLAALRWVAVQSR